MLGICVTKNDVTEQMFTTLKMLGCFLLIHVNVCTLYNNIIIIITVMPWCAPS